MGFGKYFQEHIWGAKMTLKHGKKIEKKKIQNVATITHSLIIRMLNGILHCIVATRPLV